MTLHKTVSDALTDVPKDWRTELALTLAASLDEEPNASMARELRALMNAIEDAKEPEVSSSADELRARRAARLADTANQ